MILNRIRSAGTDMPMSGRKWPMMIVLERTHFLDKIGKDHIYPTLDRSIAAIHEPTYGGGHEEECPLLTVRPRPDLVLSTGE